jgi:hypothetical protein
MHILYVLRYESFIYNIYKAYIYIYLITLLNNEVFLLYCIIFYKKLIIKKDFKKNELFK